MSLSFLFYKSYVNQQLQQDTRTTHYKEPGRDGQFYDCTEKMYWRNCAKMMTRMPKKNVRANLDTD